MFRIVKVTGTGFFDDMYSTMYLPLIVVFGESAGAIAIGSLLVADGGKLIKNAGLFRGAIMQSGAPAG